MASAELKETFLHLRDHCIWVRTCFNTNKDLFGSGRERIQIMERTAPQFFSELNRILYENFILQVCKLTDGPGAKVDGEYRHNLTAAHLNGLLAAEKLMTSEIRTASEGLLRYRALIVQARNRSIGHQDKETVMTYITLGKHTEDEALAFLQHLGDYVDAVGEAIGEGPLDFSVTAGPGDAADLFRALKGG